METNTKTKDSKKLFGSALNQRALIIVLLAAVLIMAGYIGLGAYNGYMINTANTYYQAGYRNGVAATVRNIMTQSQNCQPVPLFFGNVTKNFIDVACLNTQTGQQQGQ